MPYTVTVTLRRNETGEVRTVDYWTWTDEFAEQIARQGREYGHSCTVEEEVRNNEQWGWLEGNQSCDCNRHRVFFRQDEEMPEGIEEDIGCSEGKYDLLELKVNGKPMELY